MSLILYKEMRDKIKRVKRTNYLPFQQPPFVQKEITKSLISFISSPIIRILKVMETNHRLQG